jgi:hypothetical protein
MERQNLDGGGWFDRSAAQLWDEARRWDGRNHISVATGSQWEHERLYRSRKGLWILHAWSQWQGTRERWQVIGADEAAEWLVKNGHYDAVPAEALAASEV